MRASLGRLFNYERAGTDFQSEQSSEVVGTCLPELFPTDLSRTRMRRCGRFVLTPGQRFWPLSEQHLRFGGEGVRLMQRPMVRVARANTMIRFRTSRDWDGQ
jgi:hypothetical protein